MVTRGKLHSNREATAHEQSRGRSEETAVFISHGSQLPPMPSNSEQFR
jgi:hypothetical protein